MSLTPRGRTRCGAFALAALALVGGACSDDSASTDEPDSSTETTIDAAAVLGEKNPATGDTLTIGYVYDGTSEAVDNSNDLVAAEAATSYVNEYLGGIGGKKVELEVCSTDQSPAGAGACVTQFAAAGVPVVLNGITGQAGSLFEPLSEVGIPVLVAAADPRDAGATIMTNGILSLAAGPAKVFADAGVEQAAIIGIDVPAASAALKQSAPLFYDKAGVGVEVVLIPPDTADMTPNIQAALTKSPGGMTVVGDPLFCTKAMAAIASSGFDGELVVIPQCINEAFLEATTNLEGATMLTTATSDPESEQFQEYEAVMTMYAGDDPILGGTAPQSYQVVLGFARLMEGVTGDVTPEAVTTAMAEMPATEMPLGDGITFQCNGEQVSISPAICSQDVLQTTLDAKGNPGTFTILEGAEVLDIFG